MVFRPTYPTSRLIISVFSSSRSRRRSCMACMESKIKCDRQVPCAKCVSKGSECTYGPSNRKALPSTITTAVTPNSSFEPHNTQGTLISPSSDTFSTSYSSRSRTTSSSQSESSSDTSFTSTSSASATTPTVQTSGLVYIRGPQGYSRKELPGLGMETSLRSPASAVQQNLSSVALYTRGYAPEAVAKTYPLPESDTTLVDELVPVSSHLSPAYGSDVFTPLFTTIFPRVSPTSALNEVTLNIEELCVRGGSPEDFPFSRLLEDSSPSSQNPMFSVESSKLDSHQKFEVDQAQGLLRLINPEATQAELQHYRQCLTKASPSGN